jgi:SAM-dependent methyltransferase
MSLIGHQTDYWNRVGPSKPFTHPVNLDRLEALLPPASRILDFGCGHGRVLALLRERGFSNLMGVDASSALIALARERHPDIPFEELPDPLHVPFADHSYDGVLLIAVLTCIPSDEHQVAIMNELCRVLRPGGLLYFSDLWLQSDTRNLERYALGYERYGLYGVFDLPEGVTLRHHDRKWIERLTSKFETVVLDEIEMRTMNGNSASGFQLFARKRS